MCANEPLWLHRETYFDLLENRCVSLCLVLRTHVSYTNRASDSKVIGHISQDVATIAKVFVSLFHKKHFQGQFS